MGLRIGIDARGLEENPAGIGVYVSNLVLGLSKSTEIEEVYAYCLSPGNDDLGGKVTWVRIPVPQYFWHVFVALDAFRRRLSLYHSTHSLIMPLILGRRVVITIHDLSPLLLPQYHTLKVKLFYQTMLGLALRFSGAVIADSESTAEDLRKLFPMLSSKLFVVPLGVSDVPVKWNPDQKNRYILSLGTLEPRKNIEGLLKSFKMLRDSSSQQVRLIIAGKKGWYYQNIFKLISTLGLEKDVEIRGYVTEAEKWQLLSKASLFVYPSWYEGFGLPVLEAMAVGVPVITSNVSSLPEVVGEAGLLADPGDNVALAEKMRKVLEDRELSLSLSHKGQERAKNFSWDKTVRSTAKVYHYVSD